jgi:hypothetical protein
MMVYAFRQSEILDGGRALRNTSEYPEDLSRIKRAKLGKSTFLIVDENHARKQF